MFDSLLWFSPLNIKEIHWLDDCISTFLAVCQECLKNNLEMLICDVQFMRGGRQALLPQQRVKFQKNKSREKR